MQVKQGRFSDWTYIFPQSIKIVDKRFNCQDFFMNFTKRHKLASS